MESPGYNTKLSIKEHSNKIFYHLVYMFTTIYNFYLNITQCVNIKEVIT